MEMVIIMRKYSGNLLKPKGLDNFLYAKPWFSLANSDAHWEGGWLGGDIAVGKVVVLLR